MLRPIFELVCLACQALTAPAPAASGHGELSLRVELAATATSLPSGNTTLRPPRGSAPPNIGDDWTLARGRSLSVYLTPSPERCAPLMEMKF